MSVYIGYRNLPGYLSAQGAFGGTPVNPDQRLSTVKSGVYLLTIGGLDYAVSNERGVSSVPSAEMSSNDPGGNMIKALLTIDDVSSNNTPAIVDYLSEKKIPVLMFMVGQWAEGYPDQLIYALKHGIIVGNHSYSHPHFSELSFEECKNEIEKNEEVLNRFYDQAGVERKFRPFRFPFGDKGGDNKEKIQEYLAEKGFNKVDDTKLQYPWWKEQGLDKDIDTFWTFDFAEYCIRPNSGFTLEDVMKKIHDPDPEDGAVLLKEGSHHLLLLHAHDETEEMVPGYYRIFIEELLKNGVEFIAPEFL